jgi:uncharacterized protein (DUF58 family)
MQYTRVKARGGPPALDPRVYADLDALVRLQFEAQGFSFLPRQPLHSVLHGRHASRLRGRGLNFEELRGYLPGDDIRNVDWKATARAGEPQVRVYTEERDRPVWLLVNQRQGMFFGSSANMKSVTAAEATALAAWRVLGAGDRVGAMVFDDSEIVTIRPQRSRNQVMRVLGTVVEKNHRLNANNPEPGDPTIINEVLRQLLPLARHDCLICLIGDGSGVDDETTRLITQLNAHNDCLFIMVYDPVEAALPRAGRLTARDGERQLAFNSSNRRLQEDFAADFQARLDDLKHLSRRQAIPLLSVSTGEPVVDQVRQLLGHRGAIKRV